MEKLEIGLIKSETVHDNECLNHNVQPGFQKIVLSSLTRRKFIMSGSGFCVGVALHGILTPSQVQANPLTDLILAVLNLLSIGEKLQTLFNRGDQVKVKFGITNQSYFYQTGHILMEIFYEQDNLWTWATGQRDNKYDAVRYTMNLGPGEYREGEKVFTVNDKGSHTVILSSGENSIKANFTVV